LILFICLRFLTVLRRLLYATLFPYTTLFRSVFGSVGFSDTLRCAFGFAAGQLRAMNDCQEKASKKGRACSGEVTDEGTLTVTGTVAVMTGFGTLAAARRAIRKRPTCIRTSTWRRGGRRGRRPDTRTACRRGRSRA